MKQANIVGLTACLVPYHNARWEAFGRMCGTPCTLVELTNKDEFPVMEVRDEGKGTYTRITLFPDSPAESLSAGAIRERIASFLDNHRPDCVCLNGYATPLALGALDWCVHHRVPTVMLSESTIWDEPRREWKEWLKSRVIRLCASALVGGAPQAEYLNKLGLSPARIFFGYNAVDNDYFENKTYEVRYREKEIRARYALPEKYFMASARFALKKNLPRLIEAYSEYRKLCSSNIAPWDLVLLGDGGGRPELTTVRSKLGLEGCVHLVGAKPYQELPVYYGLASAFVHASTIEQWGLVVNEAMASGLPVLVSNRCGCARDLVEEGVNGFTFDPYRIDDIADKLLRLSIMDERLPEMGKASRKIIAKLSPQKFAQGLSQAIEIALSSAPPRATWFDRALLRILIHR